VPRFTEPENWPLNSPKLNTAHYSVWELLEQMVYCHKISDTDQQKQVLIDFWAELSQDTLNPATDHLPKRLMMVVKAKGGHFEFRLN